MRKKGIRESSVTEDECLRLWFRAQVGEWHLLRPGVRVVGCGEVGAHTAKCPAEIICCLHVRGKGVAGVEGIQTLEV